MAGAVLMFLEGQDRIADRREAAVCAAVAGSWGDPATAWPHIFAAQDDGTSVPVKGADMSQFKWEAPSEGQAAAELEALMHGARVTLPTGPDPAEGKAPPPPPPPMPMTGDLGPTDTEWT
jgi:hypothetical protein